MRQTAILATRTIALWRFNKYVKLLVIGGYLEIAVSAFPGRTEILSGCRF